MNDLIVVGAGGFGREVAWLATEAITPCKVLGFLDDRTDIPAAELGGYALLGSVDSWQDFPCAQFVIAIGNPRVRSKVAQRMEASGKPHFAILVHNSCIFGPKCRFQEGAIVGAGCILTTNIRIGSHAIVNIGSTVGHDVEIGAFVTIAPNVSISGCVTLADGVEIGTAAAIRQGLVIGKGGMLGMGSTLTKKIPDNHLYFGVPAKPVKPLDPFDD
jgi:sugar O-acyltransferase (sialic acid O-acetyltransferase NeuD family)